MTRYVLLGILLSIVLGITEAQNVVTNCVITGYNINIRQAPGTEQLLMGTLNGSAQVAESASDASDRLWWRVDTGWVASWVVSTNGECIAPTANNSIGNSLIIESVGINLPLDICRLVDDPNRSDTTQIFDTSQVWYRACFLEYLDAIDSSGVRYPLFIAAHYDLTNGNPAAFWNLKQIQIGAIVIVNWQGVQYTYQVTNIYTTGMYNTDIFYDISATPCLNLMTSHGRDIAAGTEHTQRYIVQACTVIQ
jgi:hypothetical protein